MAALTIDLPNVNVDAHNINIDGATVNPGVQEGDGFRWLGRREWWLGVLNALQI